MKAINVFSLLLLVFLLGSSSLLAQKKGDDKDKKENKTQSNHEQIKGTLKQKPWAKSGQSYCAQGSDYFVLVTDEGTEHVLDFSEYASPAAQWKKWINKPVRVKGRTTSRTIKGDNDPMSQRPISVGPDGKETTDFTCTVFTVKSLNPLGKGETPKTGKGDKSSSKEPMKADSPKK